MTKSLLYTHVLYIIGDVKNDVARDGSKNEK